MNYFTQTEQIERVNLQRIFNTYFKKRNCKNLRCTIVGSYASHDAIMLSASTHGNRPVVIEYKNRDIPVSKYWNEGSLIEKMKLDKLFKLHKMGLTVLYIVDFSDYTVIFNLSSMFKEKSIRFTRRYCTSTTANYLKGEVLKVVALLPFGHVHNLFLSR